MDKGEQWVSSQMSAKLLEVSSMRQEPPWVMWLKISEPQFLDLLADVGNELEQLLEVISNPKGYAEQQALEARSAALLVQTSQRLRMLRESVQGKDANRMI